MPHIFVPIGICVVGLSNGSFTRSDNRSSFPENGSMHHHLIDRCVRIKRAPIVQFVGKIGRHLGANELLRQVGCPTFRRLNAGLSNFIRVIEQELFQITLKSRKGCQAVARESFLALFQQLERRISSLVRVTKPSIQLPSLSNLQAIVIATVFVTDEVIDSRVPVNADFINDIHWNLEHKLRRRWRWLHRCQDSHWNTKRELMNDSVRYNHRYHHRWKTNTHLSHFVPLYTRCRRLDASIQFLEPVDDGIWIIARKL